MNATTETILNQLGGRKFLAMTGAKNLLVSDDKLQFQLPARFALNGITAVWVKLEANDTYTLTFWKIRGIKCDVVATVEDVYCDNLRAIFTEYTGLDCTL